jgi:folate-binding protein YgfZ
MTFPSASPPTRFRAATATRARRHRLAHHRNASRRSCRIGYDAARIALGLADSEADLGSGEFFPHEANLDQLGGVSFKKGCYVGQEIVSRMEHRGTARNRILPVNLDGAAPPKGHRGPGGR